MLLGGCATTIPKEAEVAYYQGNLRKAVELAQPFENDLNRNIALNNANLGTMYMTCGAYGLALPPLSRAGKVMERTITSPGNAFWSIVSREDFKEFKGEPFERSMCHYYRGIIHYRNAVIKKNPRDYEAALAAFRRALDADKDTTSKFDEDCYDFSVAYYLAARCYDFLGEPDTAETYRRQCPHADLLGPADGNTLFVVEWGDGPLKQRNKNLLTWNALAEIKGRSTGIEYATIFVDGRERATIPQPLSVTRQAEANTEKTANTIQKCKVAAKWIVRVCAFVGAAVPVGIYTRSPGAAVAAGAGAALAAGTVVRSEADVRIWNLLPGELAVGTLDISPGEHHIAVCYYDSSGWELSQWRQVFYYCHIDRYDNLVYARPAFARYGHFEFTEEEKPSSELPCELESEKWCRIPSPNEDHVRIIPTPPALWPENQVYNLTIF